MVLIFLNHLLNNFLCLLKKNNSFVHNQASVQDVAITNKINTTRQLAAYSPLPPSLIGTPTRCTKDITTFYPMQATDRVTDNVLPYTPAARDIGTTLDNPTLSHMPAIVQASPLSTPTSSQQVIAPPIDVVHNDV